MGQQILKLCRCISAKLINKKGWAKARIFSFLFIFEFELNEDFFLIEKKTLPRHENTKFH